MRYIYVVKIFLLIGLYGSTSSSGKYIDDHNSIPNEDQDRADHGNTLRGGGIEEIDGPSKPAPERRLFFLKLLGNVFKPIVSGIVNAVSPSEPAPPPPPPPPPSPPPSTPVIPPPMQPSIYPQMPFMQQPGFMIPKMRLFNNNKSDEGDDDYDEDDDDDDEDDEDKDDERK